MVVDSLSEAEVDRIFQALADRTRRDLLVRASEREQSVSELARRYEMSLTAVQKHVDVLVRAALVSKRRRGREQIVQGDPSTLRRAGAVLDGLEAVWIRRVTQIAAMLGEEGAQQ